MKIEFEIPGMAVAKARVRVGKFGAYTPSKTKNYENWVKMCFVQKYKKFEPLQGRLRAKIYVAFPILKNATKKDKLLMLEGIISPAKKPDWDNLGKAVCDALNGLAYRDDSQIVNSQVIKYYSDNVITRVEIEEF